MKYSVFVGGLLAGSLAAGSVVASEPVRIGFLTDMTAAYSDIAGPGAEIAARMAVDDYGGEVLGQPVELLVEDTQLDGERALAIGQRMHEEEGIVALAEMVGTQVALPLQEYAREHNLPALHVGSASSILTGSECSSTAVDWVYDTYALAGAVVPAMAEQGHESWYFVTVDYVFGDVLQADAEAMIEAVGGEVVGSTRHEFQAPDLFAHLEKARDSGADVIAFANAGADLRNSIRQAYELGILGGDDQEVVALLATINDIQSVGMFAARDLIYLTSFYWNLDEQTREWSRRFEKRHGVLPSMLQAGSYSVIYNFLEAMDRAGTTDGEAVVDALRTQQNDDFFARNSELRPDGRLQKDMYLVQVRPPQEMERRGDYLRVLQTIPGEEAVRPLEDSECPYL